MKNYIIVGCQRSGTTAIHLLLRGHSNVSALEGEVQVVNFFNPNLLMYTAGLEHSAKKKMISSVFKSVCLENATRDTMASGMKLALSNGTDAEQLFEIVRSYLPEVKIIYIKRDNLLDQYVSLVRARKTQKWHSWYENNKSENFRLKINKKDLELYLYKTLRCRAFLEKLKGTNEFMEYNYSQLENKDFGGLYDFLEIPHVEPTWLKAEKVSPNPDDYVKNHGEIQDYVDFLQSDFDHLESIIKSRKRKASSQMLKFLSRGLNALNGRLHEKTSILNEKL